MTNDLILIYQLTMINHEFHMKCDIYEHHVKQKKVGAIKFSSGECKCFNVNKMLTNVVKLSIHT